MDIDCGLNSQHHPHPPPSSTPLLEVGLPDADDGAQHEEREDERESRCDGDGELPAAGEGLPSDQGLLPPPPAQPSEHTGGHRAHGQTCGQRLAHRVEPKHRVWVRGVLQHLQLHDENREKRQRQCRPVVGEVGSLQGCRGGGGGC